MTRINVSICFSSTTRSSERKWEMHSAASLAVAVRHHAVVAGTQSDHDCDQILVGSWLWHRDIAMLRHDQSRILIESRLWHSQSQSRITAIAVRGLRRHRRRIYGLDYRAHEEGRCTARDDDERDNAWIRWWVTRKSNDESRVIDGRTREVVQHNIPLL